MALFDKPIDCNKCGQQFTVDDSRLGSLRNGDLEVQYFSCPACGTKYHPLGLELRENLLLFLIDLLILPQVLLEGALLEPLGVGRLDFHPGGLLQHSLNVLDALRGLLSWQSEDAEDTSPGW